MINEACSKEITHFFYDLASNITDNEMSTFVKVLDTMKKTAREYATIYQKGYLLKNKIS